ncbi:hypothetical protein B9Z19DRAFT_1070645 [Tuber borchii]|uniref:Uncharacterized protein n=1 Tax=Tuber borchii TaxID=42251 RepID=A0A2T7A8R8_TUBBO|nr:hypothetical protein B9Z19DRAFT_1070645 [Tuber borchii]
MEGLNPPPATPPLQSLYPTLIRPIIAPDFCQPLLVDAIAYLDPLIADTTIFTAPQRIREIGVEIDGIVRSLRRANAAGEVSGDDSAAIEDGRKLLEQVRRGRLRSRLDNQSFSASTATEEVLARAQERRKAFDAEMNREEEESLKAFKEGLRRTVESR